MPLITRRSSTRGLPGLPRGRWGSIAAQALSDNHNKCVIAASSSVRLKEAAIRQKDSMRCMSSQPSMARTRTAPIEEAFGLIEVEEYGGKVRLWTEAELWPWIYQEVSVGR